MRNRGKLSPVNETRPSDYPSSPGDLSKGIKDSSNLTDNSSVTETSTVDDYFEMVQPGRPYVSQGQTDSDQARDTVTTPKAPSPEENMFKRVKVPPRRQATSALTSKLASTGSASTNPFSELYALISGRAETASMEVIVFFPHATKPLNKPMKLTVRKDATVEETIGYALWNYWEEGWLPKLDEGLSEEQKKTRLSGVGWVLRIAEEDGEVDEDFPGEAKLYSPSSPPKHFIVQHRIARGRFQISASKPMPSWKPHQHKVSVCKTRLPGNLPDSYFSILISRGAEFSVRSKD